MSYYDTPSLPSTHLGPADINPAYSSFDGFDDGSYKKYPTGGMGSFDGSAQAALFFVAIAALCATPFLVGYTFYKKGQGFVISSIAGLGSVALMDAAAENVPEALPAIPAAAAYFAYKAGKGY